MTYTPTLRHMNVSRILRELFSRHVNYGKALRCIRACCDLVSTALQHAMYCSTQTEGEFVSKERAVERPTRLQTFDSLLLIIGSTPGRLGDGERFRVPAPRWLPSHTSAITIHKLVTQTDRG